MNRWMLRLRPPALAIAFCFCVFGGGQALLWWMFGRPVDWLMAASFAIFFGVMNTIQGRWHDRHKMEKSVWTRLRAHEGIKVFLPVVTRDRHGTCVKQVIVVTDHRLLAFDQNALSGKIMDQAWSHVRAGWSATMSGDRKTVTLSNGPEALLLRVGRSQQKDAERFVRELAQ
ncbi:hypothetical protein ACIBI4_04750 [Streptomyces sp. NPDC050418]|uniref:hypothetical protein n=1 Tax=Streptomyces sp. NPDC050418 TaxID=3365612 RepID=UPI00378AEDC2